ncbi:MAG: HlyD family type I secretion periplasmic adaptor subunit [Rhizobiales bacterium]|nr:HlyD family type I secretion periplasmic adaptor subunit [Hyphomicrobiales bacterium]
MEKAPTIVARSLNRHLLFGMLIILTLIGGIGGWAAIASISGAIIAQGTLVVESNVKQVQHRDGGIVSEILVENGDRVSVGDLLVRLDDTLTRANLAIVTKQMDELMARQARLEAEQNNDETIVFPQSLLARKNETHLEKAIAGEISLINARRTIRHSQKEQLRFRIEQLDQEILGLRAQREAKSAEINLIAQELEGLEGLHERGHVPLTRILALQREEARLGGETGQLVAQIARTRGQISEIELQLTQLGQNLLTEVVQELREVQSRIVELVERRVAAEDQLKHVEIRSPRSGHVHQLSVHTVGGVISPGETFALIVPEEDKLIVEARLDPANIDQVTIGQNVVLRFSAFNQRTTPEIEGFMQTISADLSQDQTNGQSFYLVRIRIVDAELEKLGGNNIVPGMPVEAFIQTAERTVMSYLLKPLGDQIMRSFREE